MYKPPQGGKKGMERERKVFRKGLLNGRSIFLLVCLVMLRGKPLIVCLIGWLRQAKPSIVCLIGWFARQTFDCIHPACFCLSAENVSPSRGTRGLGAGVCQGLWTRFGEWFAGFVWCAYFFETAWTTVFKTFANHGAYTFHFHTYLLKV